MKVNVEAYGLKIGKDNSVTDALYDGKWGVRFTFLSSELDNKYDAVLTVEEARNLINKINASLESIDKVKLLQKGNKS